MRVTYFKVQHHENVHVSIFPLIHRIFNLEHGFKKNVNGIIHGTIPNIFLGAQNSRKEFNIIMRNQ